MRASRPTRSFSARRPREILFLRKQGIAELAECLRDHNTDVKATSLRILCLLAAESAHARDEMRTVRYGCCACVYLGDLVDSLVSACVYTQCGA
jgi:hypothetical protein